MNIKHFYDWATLEWRKAWNPTNNRLRQFEFAPKPEFLDVKICGNLLFIFSAPKPALAVSDKANYSISPWKKDRVHRVTQLTHTTAKKRDNICHFIKVSQTRGSVNFFRSVFSIFLHRFSPISKTSLHIQIFMEMRKGEKKGKIMNKISHFMFSLMKIISENK